MATKLTTKNPSTTSSGEDTHWKKKNQKEGDPGEEGDDVRIDNSPPLETQAQEQESNPEPGFPRAAGPMDCPPAFSGVKPPQADAEDDGSPSETD
ncbi:hypothetical protein DSO57_1019293 [Entomophthora muscae]|uniref:Uncharacterized protein n=1 Tax=Entomophthora muscae TaxID=34485 RepID=A0ACC2S642_9FUNG|nr:hypothetical protein DSO57_1019293 [Entomophthora muscae]